MQQTPWFLKTSGNKLNEDFTSVSASYATFSGETIKDITEIKKALETSAEWVKRNELSTSSNWNDAYSYITNASGNIASTSAWVTNNGDNVIESASNALQWTQDFINNSGHLIAGSNIVITTGSNGIKIDATQGGTSTKTTLEEGEGIKLEVTNDGYKVSVSSEYFDTKYLKINALDNVSSNWDSTYNSVFNNSAEWGKGGLTKVSTNSPISGDGTEEKPLGLEGGISELSAGNGINLSEFSKDGTNYIGIEVTDFDPYQGDTDNWNSTYNTVLSESANWNSNYNTVNTNSAKWEGTNNIVTINSSNWNENYDTVNDNSGKWDSTYNSVFNNSAEWGKVGISTIHTNSPISGKGTEEEPLGFEGGISELSAGNGINLTEFEKDGTNYIGIEVTDFDPYQGDTDNWNSTYNTVLSESAKWNSNYNTVNNSSGNWNNTYNTVNDNSGKWEDTNNTVYVNSGKWGETGLTTVYKNAPLSGDGTENSPLGLNGEKESNWNNTNTTLSTNSGKWEGTNTTLSTNSGNWDSTYNSVLLNSAIWNKTGLTKVIKNAPLTGDGTNESPIGLDEVVKSKWDNTNATLSTNSGKWENTHTSVSNNSGNWNSTYNSVFNNSSKWDEVGLTSVSVNSPISGDGNENSPLGIINGIESYIPQISGGNGINVNNFKVGEKDYVGIENTIYNQFNESSVNWNSTYNTVSNNSGNWNEVGLTSVSVNSPISGNGTEEKPLGFEGGISELSAGNGINLTEFVKDGTNYIGIESTSEGGISNVVANSPLSGNGTSESPLGLNGDKVIKWDNTYNTVSTNSANWNETGLTSVKTDNSITGNGTESSPLGLDETTKSQWDNTYNTVSTNSAEWGKGGISTIYVNSPISGEGTEAKPLGFEGGISELSAGNGINLSEFSKDGTNYIGIEVTDFDPYQGDTDNWNSTYNTVLNGSAKWNSNYNTVNTNSAKWENGISTLSTNSGKWEGTNNNLTNNSGNWNNTYNLVLNNSSKWNEVGLTSVNTDNSISGNGTNESPLGINGEKLSKWDNSYNTVSTNSAKWGEVGLTSVNTNNSITGDGTSITPIGIEETTKSKWDSTNVTVSTNSGNWNNTYNTLLSNSGDWVNTYNTVLFNSGTWDDLGLTSVSVNSPISGNGTEEKPLGITNGIESFIPQVSGGNGINVSKFTKDSKEFVGVENSLYEPFTTNSSNWNNTYNTVLDNSADWSKQEISTIYVNSPISGEGTEAKPLGLEGGISELSAGNGVNLTEFEKDGTNYIAIEVTDFDPYQGDTDNWNNTYSTVLNESAKWNEAYNSVSTNGTNWNDTYNSVLTNSAKWSETGLTGISTNNVITGDGTSESPLGLNEESKNQWDNTYNTVSTNSADWGNGGLTDIIVNSPISGNGTEEEPLGIDLEMNELSAGEGIKIEEFTKDDKKYVGIKNTLYTPFNTKSTNWDSTYNTVSTNSAEWGKGGTNGEYLPLSGGTVSGTTTFKMDEGSSRINIVQGDWSNSININRNKNSVGETMNENVEVGINGNGGFSFKGIHAQKFQTSFEEDTITHTINNDSKGYNGSHIVSYAESCDSTLVPQQLYVMTDTAQMVDVCVNGKIINGALFFLVHNV